MRRGADLNGDNLRINRAYLWISDHCRVTVSVRVRAKVRIRVWVRVSIRVRLGLELRIVVYKLLEKVTKCGSVT